MWWWWCAWTRLDAGEERDPAVLPHPEKRDADVAHDFETHLLRRGRKLVQRHAIHLDSVGELFLLKVDVPHVDAQPAALREALVFYDGLVRLQRLLVLPVFVILVRPVTGSQAVTR